MSPRLNHACLHKSVGLFLGAERKSSKWLTLRALKANANTHFELLLDFRIDPRMMGYAKIAQDSDWRAENVDVRSIIQILGKVSQTMSGTFGDFPLS